MGYSLPSLLPKKQNKSELDSIGKEITEIELDANVKKRLDEIEKRMNLQRDKIRKRGFILIANMVLFLVFIFSQSIVIKYKLDKISNYEQKIKTVKPYLSQNEYDLFNSSFAQIKNISDYDKLINSLKRIALQKNFIMK